MKPVSTFGVISFKKAPIITEVLQRIDAWAQRTGTTVLFHPLLADRTPAGGLTCDSEAQFLDQSQVLLSVGGDGTFLSVAHLCKFSTKPVVGINLGTLGFLTSIALENLEADLLSISRGEYAVLQRAVLRGSIDAATPRSISFMRSMISLSTAPPHQSWLQSRYGTVLNLSTITTPMG